MKGIKGAGAAYLSGKGGEEGSNAFLVGVMCCNEVNMKFMPDTSYASLPSPPLSFHFLLHSMVFRLKCLLRIPILF